MIDSLRMVLIVLLVIFLDQFSKFLVLQFNFPHTTNQGVAFGLFPSFGWVLVFIISAILAIGFFKFGKNFFNSPKFFLPSTLILGGGVANLIDRARLGYVVDFIDLRIWPAFNLADAAIVIGSLILAWQILFQKKVN